MATPTGSGLWSDVRSDLYRVHGENLDAMTVVSLLNNPSLRHITFFRAAQHYGRTHPLGFLARLSLRWSGRRYGFQIPVTTRIGQGFYIGHFGTIVINGASKIGNNCNIAHNVTIGQANRGARKGAPSIGNNVWIGTGAVIVGRVHIGDNVLIAPNAYVNVDIPSNSLVIGNPATVHQKTPTVVDDYIDRRI